MAESEGTPGSGRIHASTEKVTGRELEKGRIRMNTEKWQNPGHYRDQVESVRVPKLLTDRLWEKGRIRVNTDKWQNPRHYRDLVESVRVPKN